MSEVSEEPAEGGGRRIEELTGPDPEIVETHISRVFLGASDVVKVKKPVDLGFLDFSTAEKRRRACEREVELNRRLSRDVYRGVVPVFGPGTSSGSPDTPDWAVHMRRLDDACRADRLLERGELDGERIGALAARLAEFHQRCRADEETASFGRVETVRDNVVENLRQTEAIIGDYIDREAALEVERWQLEFLDAHAELFAARIDAGRVRDGHGDLRLEHVYFEPEEPDEGDTIIQVIDCIEFNDRFRYADVAADLAFLAMDLRVRGAADLAEALLADSARLCDDYDLYPLIDFYESYRAFVRGKVLAMTVEGSELDHDREEELRLRARRHFLLAQASERRPVVAPKVVAVGGWIASGKSTVAAQIAGLLACPVVASDWTRKGLLGRRPTEGIRDPAFAGSYDAATTARVYREVLRRAQVVVESGRSVVLDCSFRDRRQRQLARRMALELGVDFLFVECRAEADVCRARLRERERGDSVSDGRLEIFDDFVAAWEPVGEIPPHQHLVLDTGSPSSEAARRLREALVEL